MQHDAAAVSYLYTAINEAAGGKPEILSKLEKLIEDPDRFKTTCPEPWAARAAFIREWLALDPPLGDVDLRPAVYLSRETVPVRAMRGSLSAAAAESMRVLMRATSSISPSAKAACAAIPAGEHAVVMAAFIEGFRKHSDWTDKPTGLDGAFTLANEMPEVGVSLGEFITTTTSGKPAPWLRVLVKDKPWFKPTEKR